MAKMALMTEERRKEMEEEMNRFEQEIALPGEEDSLSPQDYGPESPMDAERDTIIQREHHVPTPPPPSAVVSLLPEVLRKGPPPPPPASSPPIPPLCAPPPPPVLQARPQVESTRFIPHQLHRHPPRSPIRHNFMGMRGPMGPPAHFPHPGHMGPFPHPMGGPHMHPGGPMHHMQHGMPMPPCPSMPHQMGNMNVNLPMPPGFCPPPGSHMSNMQRDSHSYMPGSMNQGYDSAVSSASVSSSSESSPSVVTSAPAVYAAPFMKSHAENMSVSLTSTNGQEQVTSLVTVPPPQKLEKLPTVKAAEEAIVAIPSVSVPEETVVNRKKDKKKKLVRMAGGQAWEDNSLQEWDPDDFRIFCGDLGNDVTDEVLIRAFSKYQSFVKAKVIRDKRTNKTKGYGFVSFKDPQDFIKAMREMNGRYVGSRPIKLRKSTWKDRNIEFVKKKQKEKEKLGLL